MSYTDEELRALADKAVAEAQIGGHITSRVRAAALLRDMLRDIYDDRLPLRTMLDLIDKAVARREQAPAVESQAKLARLEDLARWLVSMDAMQTEAGWTLRQTVSLNDIIERAREALGEDA